MITNYTHSSEETVLWIFFSIRQRESRAAESEWEERRKKCVPVTALSVENWRTGTPH